jgi:hypothetical protein
MFAVVKVIIAIAIACGTMVASIVETPYHGLAACFWLAFLLGVWAAERMRALRQRRVRYLSSRLMVSAKSFT